MWTVAFVVQQLASDVNEATAARANTSAEYAFCISNAGTDFNDCKVTLTGKPSNDACRFVNWLLTMPLSFIKLFASRIYRNINWSPRASPSAALRLRGEIRDRQDQRFIWWVLAMCPFAFVVQQLADSFTATACYDCVRIFNS